MSSAAVFQGIPDYSAEAWRVASGQEAAEWEREQALHANLAPAPVSTLADQDHDGDDPNRWCACGCGLVMGTDRVDGDLVVEFFTTAGDNVTECPTCGETLTMRGTLAFEPMTLEEILASPLPAGLEVLA